LGLKEQAMSKVPCTKCGNLILPDTAQRTGGVCMPCKSGTRDQIEASKKEHVRQRELDKTCPYRALWRQLHSKVYSEGGGFHTLTKTEKTYWALNLLEGEVYNGGFDQFFHNSSGSHYLLVTEGLKALGAEQSLSLLHKAKQILFADRGVPENTTERRTLLLDLFPESTPDSLNALDDAYWKNPDQLGEKLETFALQNGLVMAQQVVQADGPASGGPAA
jgi:hypothetical protein